jgi:hypothetical protein
MHDLSRLLLLRCLRTFSEVVDLGLGKLPCPDSVREEDIQVSVGATFRLGCVSKRQSAHIPEVSDEANETLNDLRSRKYK